MLQAEVYTHTQYSDMPTETTFYQRFFHRDFFLTSIIHPIRTAIMRRLCNDRVCFLMSVLLLFYTGWHMFTSPKYVLQFQLDSAEKLAYTQAMNKSSPIIQNTHICSFDEVDLLFIILSSSSHFLERQSIRETWGSMPDLFGVHSQRLFVIGYHSGGHFYRDLSNEATHEQDILYLTIDDHLNTLKELHTYRWLEKHCSNVKYIFKTEDSLFVNSLLLHELVRELKTKPNNVQNRNLYGVLLDSLFLAQKAPNTGKFLFGWAYQPGVPERHNTASPFYVPYQEYSQEMYPRYCSGFGYLMNSKTRNALAAEGFKDEHPFRFPDIYVTGILPERLNYVCEVLPFTYHQGLTDDCLELIKKSNGNDSSSPLLMCSTGRQVGENSYSDYYKIWTDLKHIYADRLHPTNN